MSDGTDRRGLLKCMAWVGTGVVWTIAGGIPRPCRSSRPRRGHPRRPPLRPDQRQPHRLQQGRQHRCPGDGPGGHRPRSTRCRRLTSCSTRATSRIWRSRPNSTSRTRSSRRSRQQVFYVPGEHDMLGRQRQASISSATARAAGAGWYSFDHSGVHFMGLVNVVEPEARRHGPPRRTSSSNGSRTTSRAARPSTPIVVFAHIPLVGGLSRVGLGHRGLRRRRWAISSASARSRCSTGTSTR